MTITTELAQQLAAIAELKAGYQLGHADVAILQDVARELGAARQRIVELKARTEQQPFMYGIAEPDGTAYMDECCVSSSISGIDHIVADLNSEVEEGQPLYKVVPLFTPASAPVVPDGWVTAPAEPTMKMVFSGASAKRDDGSELWNVNAIYQAMLAAAPREGE